MSETFRDVIYRASPRWLQGTLAGRILYTFGLHLDALVDGATQAVKRRFPGLTGYNDEIGLIGKERGIRRGRNESDASYALRMRDWWEAQGGKGGPYTLLNQLGDYYADNPFKIELVYRSGARFVREVDGTITRDFVDWMAPELLPAKHTWWLLYHWPVNVIDDGDWDDPGTWDDGGLWDYNLTAIEAEDIRTVPGNWNRADADGYVALIPDFVPDPTDTIDPDFWLDPEHLSGEGIALLKVA